VFAVEASSLRIVVLVLCEKEASVVFKPRFSPPHKLLSFPSLPPLVYPVEHHRKKEKRKASQKDKWIGK